MVRMMGPHQQHRREHLSRPSRLLLRRLSWHQNSQVHGPHLDHNCDAVAETCCLCEEFGCEAFDAVCQASVQRATATLSVFASGTVPDTKTHITTMVEVWTIDL